MSHLMNDLRNHGGVFRTAPATLGLLNKLYGRYFFSKDNLRTNLPSQSRPQNIPVLLRMQIGFHIIDRPGVAGAALQTAL